MAGHFGGSKVSFFIQISRIIVDVRGARPPPARQIEPFFYCSKVSNSFEFFRKMLKSKQQTAHKRGETNAKNSNKFK